MSLHTYIAQQFAAPRGVGGRMVSFVMSRQNIPLYEETARLLALSPADSVLDIGCGNGYMLNMLARQYGGAFSGIDISPGMIQTASRLNRAYVQTGRVKLSRQDVRAMSFAGGSFSKAYTVNTVYFWADLSGTMAEISRVLQAGGIFINTLYSNETLNRLPHTQTGYRRFSKEQLTQAGTNAGFAVDIAPILKGAAYCCLYRKIG